MRPGPRYEYGVVLGDDDEAHRSGMTEPEASAWIREWAAEGGRRDAVALIRRPIGRWEFVYVMRCEAASLSGG